MFKINSLHYSQRCLKSLERSSLKGISYIVKLTVSDILLCILYNVTNTIPVFSFSCIVHIQTWEKLGILLCECVNDITFLESTTTVQLFSKIQLWKDSDKL